MLNVLQYMIDHIHVLLGLCSDSASDSPRDSAIPITPNRAKGKQQVYFNFYPFPKWSGHNTRVSNRFYGDVSMESVSV